MAPWEQILLGLGAAVIVVVFWPGIRAAMERSRQAEERDWAGALLPIGVVVLFVILLILFARS